MRTSTQAGRARRPSGLPARLLLVLAVLTGIVGMHGLGPGALPPAAAHAAAHSAAAEHPSADPCDCVHADGPGHEGPSGGHAQHADPTCAASGTSGAPVLHAPAAAPGGIPAGAEVPHGAVLGARACGRAPPSLSELQLLRV
ncbi:MULTISPECIES: DUF6153 family protein [Streptomyces]|uniref:DUF6153 family protein n=1 Tax=Streptomyces katrae TaxID=68223 RepID=A0ABT7H2C5_9ACTN|nr:MULTISPECIES: DUF6153 family protein [Streptomyces]MDK9499621.1 DUF6153 family protein [Streptomyces katrae]RST00720.1 hypothetical protein EF910_30535 [Streptomyces sp. WAC07149]GLX17594.1 hypothetical protein Slala01_12380 [Streptomyces lavendulae subsp. lavendulae]GLX24545.1 hypothetical protein Slala02_03650 [Streptomyces lavendulae subsp. lavendulae]